MKRLHAIGKVSGFKQGRADDREIDAAGLERVEMRGLEPAVDDRRKLLRHISNPG